MTIAHVARSLARFVHWFHGEAAQLWCSLDGHGPFTLPVVSTADSSPPPALWCATCATDCSHLFMIEKVNGTLRIWNARTTNAIVVTYDDEISLASGALVIYSRGKFLVGGDRGHEGRSKASGPGSGSRENDHDGSAARDRISTATRINPR